MTAASALPVETKRRGEQLDRLRSLAARAGGPIVLVVLVAVFAVTMPDTFATRPNLQSLVAAQCVPGILALGLLFPLVAGEFDFSGGAVASASAAGFVLLVGEHGLAWPLAALVVTLGAVVVGIVNGILVSKLHYGSFVATLAVGGIVVGLTLAHTKGQTLYEGVPRQFTDLGQRTLLGGPYPAWYLLGVFAVVAVVLRQTPWGRYHEAVGKGRAAATLAGVDVARHVLLAFVASSALAGFAGLVLVARLGSAPPNVGEAFTLSAFAAAFLGATMLRPGFFNATGTLVAVLLIAVGINGLSLAGVDTYIERIFTGGVLLIAVGLSKIERRNRL